jgi:hypothetical protein
VEQISKPDERGAESKADRRLRKEAENALDDYYEVWRTAPAGAINREMALQVHLLARTTAEKYAALRKVYGGVMILLGLTAVFLIVLALHLIAPSIV